MSVHWAKADIRLRASGSDFDPRVRPLKANGGGWSNLWRLSAPDRWALFIGKKFNFFGRKTPFGGRKLQKTHRHKADISGLDDPLLTETGVIGEQSEQLGALAERYFQGDPPTAIFKLRQFAELLSKLLAAHHRKKQVPIRQHGSSVSSLAGDNREGDIG